MYSEVILHLFPGLYLLYFPCALLLCVCLGHAWFCRPLDRDYNLCLPFEPKQIEDIFSTKTMVQN